MESAANAKGPLSELIESARHFDIQEFLSCLPSEAQEYFKSVRHHISHEELPLVRSEIKRTAKQIYDNWGLLEHIVQRHEAVIQKRWTKKSIAKRRELLLAAWPNMARDRRPDIVLVNKAANLMAKVLLLGGQGQKPKQFDGPQREALLMPYMNLHNLTKTEPLLLMINARARRPPHAFSRRDVQLSTTHVDLTKWRDLRHYVMDLTGGQSVPESYGELRQAPKECFPVVIGADIRLLGGLVGVGDGLWALEIQDRIYGFLLDMVQRILHDIPYGDLTGTKYSIQTEPPLPSANSLENGVVTLANTNMEAIYSSPAQMNLNRLHSLLNAKANEEEDKLWALREDPGRFSEDVEDLLAHRSEYVQDCFGKQHPIITMDAHEAWGRSDIRSLEDLLSTECLIHSCENVEYWCGLVRDITALMEAKAQHFDSRDIEPGAPLPEPFALELYKFQFVLSRFIQKRLWVLRMAAYSSPPIRPFVRRASPETLDEFVLESDEDPPSHIAEFMRILACLFSDTNATLRGHVASVQLLLEEYDMFIDTVPDAQQAVTSYVAEEISRIALLSECLRQVHLFQPFEGSSNGALRIKDAEEVYIAHINEISRKTALFASFLASVRVRSIAADLAKRPYPVHKKRSAENVRAMQDAEMLLDQMWNGWLAEMEQQICLPTHTKKVLFLQGRQLQRTPAWIQPEPVEPTHIAPPQSLSAEALVQPFGEFKIDGNTKAPIRPAEKTKVKTRGAAAPQDFTSNEIETAQPEGQSRVHTIQVDRRAIKVFSALFHTPSSTSTPREVPWNEFLHAMRSAGFWVEKLYGSVWQFAPRDGSNHIHMATGVRAILFHEPHPHSRIPFRQARRHGRRLTRAYGWSGQTFVLKH